MTDTPDPHEVLKRADTLIQKHNYLMDLYKEQLETKDKLIEELKRSNAELAQIALDRGSLKPLPENEAFRGVI